MAKGKSIIKLVTGASFLFVLILLLVFLYAQSFNPSGIFPQDTEAWNKILTGYLLIFALVLITTLIVSRETIVALTKAKYWKAFAYKFIPSAIITSIILIILKGIIEGTNGLSFFTAIAYMPIYVLLVHLFVITQVEEILFGGLIFTIVQKRSSKSSANIVTMVLFALWHFAKTGGNWIIMLTYVPLRFWWNHVRNNGTPVLNKFFPKFFGPTPQTQQANAGSHFGWNMFVIGFLKPFQI